MIYDNSGNLIEYTSEIFYYLPQLSNTPDFGFAQPKTRYDYNAFAEKISTAKLVDPKNQIWAWTSTWYDQAGKIIAESNPNFFIRRYQRNVFGEEIERAEYANCLSVRPDPTQPVANIDKALVPNPNEDRTYVKTYNLRGNQNTEILKNIIAQALTSSGGLYSFYDLPAQDLVTTFAYDALSRKNKITYPNGGVVYYYFDALNHLLAETGIPRNSEDEGSQPVVKVPLTLYGYSSHGFQVWQQKYKFGTDYKKFRNISHANPG